MPSAHVWLLVENVRDWCPRLSVPLWLVVPSTPSPPAGVFFPLPPSPRLPRRLLPPCVCVPPPLAPTPDTRTCASRNSILACTSRCSTCQSTSNMDLVRDAMDTFSAVVASVSAAPVGEPPSLLAAQAVDRVVDLEELTKERRRVLLGEPR